MGTIKTVQDTLQCLLQDCLDRPAFLGGRVVRDLLKDCSLDLICLSRYLLAFSLRLVVLVLHLCLLLNEKLFPSSLICLLSNKRQIKEEGNNFSLRRRQRWRTSTTRRRENARR